MEPFSVAAAAVTLCPVIIGITSSLCNAAKSIKYARRELEDLTNEMLIFSVLYRQFLELCSKNKKDKQASSVRKRLKSWAEKAIFDFEKLSRHVDALSTKPLQHHSATETLTAHFKWYLKKSTLKYFRASLIVARQSMLGFINICNIERLDEELAMLRSVLTRKEKLEIEKKTGKTVEELIQLLQQDKDTQRIEIDSMRDVAQNSMKQVSSRQSQSQNLDFAGHTERLLRFSSVVDRHAEHILPFNESSKRHFRSSKSPSRRPRLQSSTSQSSGTIYTQSSQSSRRRPAAAPESPFTSPESSSSVSNDGNVSSSVLIHHRTRGDAFTYPGVHGNMVPEPLQRKPRRSDPAAAARLTTHLNINQHLANQYIVNRHMDLERRKKEFRNEYSGSGHVFDLDEYAIYVQRKKELNAEASHIKKMLCGWSSSDLPLRSSAEPPESTERLANTFSAQGSGNDIAIENEQEHDEVKLAARVEDAEEATDEEEEEEATEEGEAMVEDTEDEEEAMEQGRDETARPSIWQSTNVFGGHEPRNWRARHERSSSP